MPSQTIAPRGLATGDVVLLRYRFRRKPWVLARRPGRDGRFCIPDGHQPLDSREWLAALRAGARRFDRLGGHA